MIESFAFNETKKIFLAILSTKLPKDIQRTARRDLIYLDDAEDQKDLLASPGSHLEKLKGSRSGQYSIRINDQWRIASSGLITKPETSRSLINICKGG